ncbi:MAG: hypothetical protein ABEH65_05405 [Halobacteriales archaeon]
MSKQREKKRKHKSKAKGQGKIALGVSILFAIGIFIYFSLGGSVLRGAVIGVVVLLAGGWEYRRKLHHSEFADTLEDKGSGR